MKILVTGGAGFIGSNVADAYTEAGHEVHVMDNLFMGDEKNINPKAKFIKADIRDKEAREAILKEKYDVINHHAAQISVPDSVKDPGTDAAINIWGILNLLDAAKDSGVKKFIFISSGGTVYGEPKDLPVGEEAPIAPENPYGISKVAGENYLKFYSKQYGIKYTILRYSNVYGPRQIPHGEAGVVAIFITRIMEGKTPVVYGGGKCVRDYVFVGDVAKANVLALEKGENEAVNIGTGQPTNVRELYNAIKKATGFDKEAEEGPFREGDILANYLKNGKAKQVLGWEPGVSLDEGILKTYEFFKTKK